MLLHLLQQSFEHFPEIALLLRQLSAAWRLVFRLTSAARFLTLFAPLAGLILIARLLLAVSGQSEGLVHQLLLAAHHV